MPAASAQRQLSPFAADVLEGLSSQPRKLSPRYFYDDLGSALFEAITLLPEYGLTRADERLLCTYARELAGWVSPIQLVAELGSGTGKKTKPVLQALNTGHPRVCYLPIDVSQAALSACKRELKGVCKVSPLCGDWLEGLSIIAKQRTPNENLLLLFLGSSVGNLEPEELTRFLTSVRSYLRPGDFFLLGADLAKDVDRMLLAYDDPTGVTAAFNLNVLARINRELDADFDLRSFAHEVRWNAPQRRIEMHLLSCRDQIARIQALEADFHFRAGETIWTESSHKFTLDELDEYAWSSGFQALTAWVDQEWPFAEVLWRAE